MSTFLKYDVTNIHKYKTFNIESFLAKKIIRKQLTFIDIIISILENKMKHILPSSNVRTTSWLVIGRITNRTSL